VGSQEQAKRKLTLGLLVERTDDFAEVIDVVVGSFRPGSGIERRAISPAHNPLQHSDLEERYELFLGVDLIPGRRC